MKESKKNLNNLIYKENIIMLQSLSYLQPGDLLQGL